MTARVPNMFVSHIADSELRKRPSVLSYVALLMCAGLTAYSFYIIWQLVFAAISQPDANPLGDLTLHARLSFLLVYYNVYLTVAIIVLAIKNLVFKHLGKSSDLIVLLGLMCGSELFTMLYSFQPVLFAMNMGINILILIFISRLFKSYSYPGINFYLANSLTILAGLCWGAWFLFSLDLSFMTRALLIGTAPLLLITLPSDFFQMLELYDIVCRQHWKRPKHPFPSRIYRHQPRISIHVPTYSEPPDMVMATIDKLAELEYDNFEVIVLDNNTRDPELWLPVKRHCERLGSPFRFVHVENLAGAKGGALNYALQITDPKVDIIGVIDADYHADPHFLRALVGYFDNSRIGFVQTPHDYRDWRGNIYLTMCYWEYKIFFHSAMVSLSERDAGITVGTMCLVRKEALTKAGGWSEWCVTEDSELAIRIHEVGYSSVYVDKTYGRGLIPETFESYKKQRYRWTAGPVQEFRHHFKNFVGLTKNDSHFTFLQRIFHLNHGLDNVLLGLNIPLTLVTIAVVLSTIIHHEIIKVPFELWLTATVTFLTAPLLTLMMYKSTIKPKITEIIGQLVAGKALSHVIHYAALRTTLTGNANWNRTNKFKYKHSYINALSATREETLIGLLLILFISAAYLLFPYTGLTLMLLIGLSYIALGYFAAPFVSLISVWALRREHRQNLKSSHETEIFEPVQQPASYFERV